MKPVTCAAGVDRLIDYIEGALPAPIRVALESHVAGCARCRAFVASYLETPRIYREVTHKEPTAEQERRLLAFLQSRTRPRG